MIMTLLFYQGNKSWLINKVASFFLVVCGIFFIHSRRTAVAVMPYALVLSELFHSLLTLASRHGSCFGHGTGPVAGEKPVQDLTIPRTGEVRAVVCRWSASLRKSTFKSAIWQWRDFLIPQSTGARRVSGANGCRLRLPGLGAWTSLWSPSAAELEVAPHSPRSSEGSLIYLRQ